MVGSKNHQALKSKYPNNMLDDVRALDPLLVASNN